MATRKDDTGEDFPVAVSKNFIHGGEAVEKVGDLLHSAREAKGISLREAEEATKIRLRYLEALEKGDYALLPGRVYALGFLRSYARYLGLDVQAVVEQFKREYPATEDNGPGSEGRLPAEGPKRGNPKKYWLVAAAVIVALWCINMLYNYLRPSLEQPSPPTQPQVTLPEPGPSSPQPPQSVVPPVSSPPRFQGVEVTIKSNGNCWVGATVDGKDDFSGILKAGESRVLQGKEKIVVTLGSAGAVEVTVNGQLQPSLGRVGEVVTFEADKDSTQAKVTRKR
ncbi:MAG: RodZ domain-containing protein [Moorella sp. (in: firmicutes)]